MVGTDFNGKGGISSLVSGYLDDGLFERFDGEYVVTHRQGSRWVKILAAFRGWLRVASLLRRLDAPLVHVHAASRASFWRKSVVCLMARLAGRPYIWHVHGAEFMQFYEQEAGPLAKSYIRSVLANADLVIALSEQWRDGLLRICPAANVEVLTNAVALPDIAEVRRAQEREPVLLFLGEICRRKGVSDLVRAFARIVGESPGLRLVCGGAGSVSELRALANDLQVPEHVSCPGWMNPERKRAALAGAAIFALPSYAEGMPMAVLEAMSWGLPVIASPVGGVPQLITHDYNGLLVAPGDVEGLAAAIRRLMQDPQLRQRLGSAARATIEASYVSDEMLTRLSQTYRRFGIESRP